MKIAVIGGGINGICCAWMLAKQGYHVDLYEQSRLMGQTSQASSKLLHGGLRYLENGEFSLVRTALRERDAWFKRAPELAKPLQIVIPIYKDGHRSRLILWIGLQIYKWLAGQSDFSEFQWRSNKQLRIQLPTLNSQGLIGGYQFYDGQMDDYELGLWVAEEARKSGVSFFENTGISTASPKGSIREHSGEAHRYDRVVNIAGPWAEKLALESGCQLPYRLDLIRGSHIVVDRPCPQALLLEVPNDLRIFFVLPWKGKTLIGTTETRQQLSEPVECSKEEIKYLLCAYNHYHIEKISDSDICRSFAGLRPLIKSYSSNEQHPSRVTREYIIHRQQNLITVLGGKWTTALALSRQVIETIQEYK